MASWRSETASSASNFFRFLPSPLFFFFGLSPVIRPGVPPIRSLELRLEGDLSSSARNVYVDGVQLGHRCLPFFDLTFQRLRKQIHGYRVSSAWVSDPRTVIRVLIPGQNAYNLCVLCGLRVGCIAMIVGNTTGRS